MTDSSPPVPDVVPVPRAAIDALIARIDEVIKALVVLATSLTWRPIAMAPRDGEEVLLWLGREMELGSFQTSRWEDAYGRVLSPTHWLPLPAPPRP